MLSRGTDIQGACQAHTKHPSPNQQPVLGWVLPKGFQQGLQSFTVESHTRCCSWWCGLQRKLQMHTRNQVHVGQAAETTQFASFKHCGVHMLSLCVPFCMGKVKGRPWLEIPYITCSGLTYLLLCSCAW